MKIALVMSVFNRLSSTISTLNYLYQTAAGKYHLYIIDDGSTDGTEEWLKNNFYLYYKYIKAPEWTDTMGKHALNLGLSAALEGNYEIFGNIDNDVILQPGWLEDCLETLDKTGGHIATALGATVIDHKRDLYKTVEIENEKYAAYARIANTQHIFTREILENLPGGPTIDGKYLGKGYYLPYERRDWEHFDRIFSHGYEAWIHVRESNLVWQQNVRSSIYTATRPIQPLGIPNFPRDKENVLGDRKPLCKAP